MNVSATLARGMVPVALMLAIAPLPASQAQTDHEVKVLVPAYFYPTWWSGSPWEDLNRAAETVPVVAIMNPASGPGPGPNADYEMAVADLRAAGGEVIGYVATGYGARPLGDVIREIGAYLSWYDVDGVFLDEMGNQLGGLDYGVLRNLIGIYEFVLGRDLLVVGNPGMPFPQVESYLNAADTLVIFEGPLVNADPWGASFAAYPDEGPYAGLPPWFLDYRPKRLANLVYDVPTADAMADVLEKARRSNAGYVYVTDDSASNPWDSLPAYWSREVEAIAEFNASRK